MASQLHVSGEGENPVLREQLQAARHFLAKQGTHDQAPEQAVSLQVQQASHWSAFRWTCLQNPDVLPSFPDTPFHPVPDGACSPQVCQQHYGETNQKAQGVYPLGLSNLTHAFPYFAILTLTTSVFYSSLSFMLSERRTTLDRKHNPLAPSCCNLQPQLRNNISHRENVSVAVTIRKSTQS